VILALIQAGLFLTVGPMLSMIGLAPAMEVDCSISAVIAAAAFLALIAAELTALGFLIAWPMNSTQGFHAIMSIFLMPMWLVSGAFFPGGDSGWLFWLIRFNPLTYGVAGLRRLLYAQTLPVTPELPSLWYCSTVTLITTLVLTTIAIRMVSRSHVRNAVS
ncbi:MAG: ABC transporter permease, partial [Planctomycetota bacterium]